MYYRIGGLLIILTLYLLIWAITDIIKKKEYYFASIFNANNWSINLFSKQIITWHNHVYKNSGKELNFKILALYPFLIFTKNITF